MAEDNVFKPKKPLNPNLFNGWELRCLFQKKDGSEGSSRTGKNKGSSGVLPPPPGGLGKIAPPPAAAAATTTVRQSPGVSPAHRPAAGGSEWTDYASAGWVVTGIIPNYICFTLRILGFLVATKDNRTRPTPTGCSSRYTSSCSSCCCCCCAPITQNFMF